MMKRIRDAFVQNCHCKTMHTLQNKAHTHTHKDYSIQNLTGPLNVVNSKQYQFQSKCFDILDVIAH